MFKKIVSTAKESGYQKLRTKGVKCPQCSSALNLPDHLPDAEFRMTLKCESCSWMGTLASLRSVGGVDYTALAKKPEGSRIKEVLGEKRATWLIPAKKKMNFLMVFSLIWLVMSSFGFVGVLTEFLESDGGDKWVGVLMLGCFVLVGLGIGYGGLRMAYTELLIRVAEDEVVLTRKFFKKMWDRKIPRELVGKVWMSEAYRQNDRPVYQIEIENKDTKGKNGGEKNGDGTGKNGRGKNLKFGSSLSHDEKRWLLGGLREMLLSSEGGISQENKTLGELETKGLKLVLIGYDGFRVTQENRSGPWLLGVGLVMMVASGVGLVFQWQQFHFDENATRVTQVLDVLFSGVPFMMTSIAFLMGLGMMLGGRWAWGRRKIFEFGKNSLEVTTQWRSSRKTERFERGTFHHVERTQSGHVNHDPRYKLNLIGESESVTIFSYEDSKVTDVVTAWVERWVGGD